MTPPASRRRFIKSAAALVSSPFLLPSGLRAAPVSPNERIAVGFIGMGRMSRGLMGHFLNDPRSVVVAVCDVDTNRREAEKQRADSAQGNSDCAAYNDFRELLARDDLDAVCIATPDHWHAIPSIDAMARGLDVYCEKPLTHNIHEAVAVMGASQEHGRVLQTGSQQRSSREFRVACELVRNGAIGKVERAEVSFGGPGVACDLPAEEPEPGLDWDFWLGPAPERPYNSILSPRGVHDHFPRWRNYWEYGGGMVTDWGAHHLDIVQWALDKDSSGPVRVLPPEGGPEATKGAVLVYESEGREIPVKHGEGIGVHLFGDEGEVQVARGRIALSRGGEMVAAKLEQEGDLGEVLDRLETEYLSEAKVKLQQSPGHVADFLDCMASRKDPITSATVGGRSVIACHLMNLGYYHGETLQWNPAENDFAGGTGKPEWLTREYRGEWKV